MCACKTLGGLIRAGMDSFNAGDGDAALEQLNDALALSGRIGSQVHQAKIRCNLALVLSHAGNISAAVRHYRTAISLVEGRLGADHPLLDRMRRSVGTFLTDAA
ncbi:tetratricopeptide repeat protein [Desulfovibrio sp. X2]|uniref:tetratricopeptide repeat protein n=1 Tax=Desulfovibrio sp. X2 TaxID=941449 RepID=UPI00155ABABE|nr:tetratricopeptide repeat protein [Desulfovibrio sp. X2]